MSDNSEAIAMARYVVNAVDAKSGRIICCIKIFYQLVVNDRVATLASSPS